MVTLSLHETFTVEVVMLENLILDTRFGNSIVKEQIKNIYETYIAVTHRFHRKKLITLFVFQIKKCHQASGDLFITSAQRGEIGAFMLLEIILVTKTFCFIKHFKICSILIVIIQ